MDDTALTAIRELASCDDGRHRLRPESGPAGEQRTLTVGMATYDDYDGVYFTVMSLLLYHPEVRDRIGLVVVDNHPAGPDAWALKRLEERVPGLRYVPYDRRVGTAARDRIFREARSDWALCLDSHVQLLPGALAALLEFIDAHPDSDDLVQGPLVAEDLRTVRTHWEPGWDRGMYGQWGCDPRGADPAGPAFEIGMQGLGVFACRTKAWPGLNPAFSGHGGEEGYLQEKFRRAGRRVLCLPALRWTHRFNRSGKVPFPHSWDRRLRNYLIGWGELGLPVDEMTDHFAGLIGAEPVERAVRDRQAEQNNPFTSFDGITCINLDERPDRWERTRARLAALGIHGDRVHRLPAVPTPGNHHIGCALSHRRAVELAHTDGLENLLVLEDDVLFLDGATWVLRRALDELRGRPWSLLYLGGADWGRTFERADGCHHLEHVTGVTTTHAIVYDRGVFSRLLDELPDNEADMAAWIGEHRAIDQYLARWDQPGCYRTVPVVAAQENQLALVPPDLHDQFGTARTAYTAS
ncbi:glycosyltransferase [Streptomyces gamaensis]|uniref:Glycosyltransferase n=1 Tax=Streptomyces gamaensis TaxID=1763542 RepID=A0ABW0YXI3_9ACTN